jgi:hypothetical protein
MSWVEARSSLQWRWIQWIQVIIFGAFLPFLMVIPETRDGVILRRKAATMRKEMRKLAGKASTNATVDAEYRARSEVDKPKLIDLVKVSLTRPVCKCPSCYVAFVHLFIENNRFRAACFRAHRPLLQSLDIDGLGCILRLDSEYTIDFPRTLSLQHGPGRSSLSFNGVSASLTFAGPFSAYTTAVHFRIGTILSFLFNFYQEYLYRKHVKTRGPEARLYAAMVGGVCFAVGCFIYAWTCKFALPCPKRFHHTKTITLQRFPMLHTSRRV